MEGTLDQEYVSNMIYFINKLDMIGAEMDGETIIDAILAPLPNSFN